MYGKFEGEKHEKYAKVRAERERAARDNLPMPNFVDLDAADYDRWLSREATRASEPNEPAADDGDVEPPEAKRARTDLPSRVRTVDADCDFDESTGLYMPTEAFRAKHPGVDLSSADRNWHVPPSDYRHYRRLAGDEDDDDGEVHEPDTKRARVFAMTMKVLGSAGVGKDDASKYCNAIMGTADAGTFVELYGRGSIVNDANGPRRSLGIKGLGAFDLRTLKPGGGNWDFAKEADRKLAMKLVQELNPDFVIGSPPCTSWCVWNQHMNYPKMCPERVKALMDEGRIHLEFIARLYRRQLANGKYFLHEQPATALSWDERCIMDLVARSDVELVVADQCQYGLTTPAGDGVRLPALKPTKFLTNAPQLANMLRKTCDRSHAHQQLVGGRCMDAAFYPLGLVRAIVRGMKLTMDAHPRNRDRSHVGKEGIINAFDKDEKASVIKRTSGGHVVVKWNGAIFKTDLQG